MTNRLGIMMGRLSPPINQNIQAFPYTSWKNEFFEAKNIGFELIEWVFDTNVNNPIIDSSKIYEIKKLSHETDVGVNSVCADYFMEKKLFAVSENELIKNLDILEILITNCHKLSIDLIELPFVDSSSLQNKKNQDEIIKNIEKIIPNIQNCNVKLGLETDLPPEDFKNLLLDLNHPNVVINYDIGNSVSNGFDPSIELPLLQRWISNIHIKDRYANGSTVSLGHGDANFELFFSALKKFGYQHDFIIQGAREDLIDSTITPQSTCEKYFKFVNKYLKDYNFKSN